MNPEMQPAIDAIKAHAAEIVKLVKSLSDGRQFDAWEIAIEFFESELDLCIHCHRMECGGWCTYDSRLE